MPLIKIYKVLVLSSGTLVPLAAIGYLSLFIDPKIKFDSSIAHEMAISFATLTLVFVTVIAYRSYQRTGDPFLRFLTLAVLGFVVIYAPHGLLTRMANHNVVLFLIFGPASRLVTSIYLLIGLLRLNRAPDAMALRTNPRRWWPHVLLFIILDLLLFFLASSSIGVGTFHLRIIESVSLAFFGLSALLMLFLRPTAPWMPYHLVALLVFMQAAVAFLMARPWNHMWWLAHAISVAGFFILGYEVIRSYETKPDGISA
jgi:hypothetical protein